MEDDSVEPTEAVKLSYQGKKDKLWAAEPYDGEPTVDANWIAIYFEPRGLKEDNIQKLRSRLH